MTAPARLEAARDAQPLQASTVAVQHWRRAEEIGREWLEHGLATKPADRTVAEECLAGIYARHSRRRPRFVWVDSPRQALPLLNGLPTHDVLQQWVMARRPPGPAPFASDLAAGISRLRSALDDGATHPDLDPPRPFRKKKDQPWPVLPPVEALSIGIPLREVLRQGVRNALWTSLVAEVCRPVRAALSAPWTVPVCWYGQQDAYWIAHYDVLRRLGLARYRSDDNDWLDLWAELARSCGWWWPGEDVCVIVDRPSTVHIGRPPDRSVGYRDGWRLPLK